MGSFVVYALEWALCLSVFLLLYKMCFSGSTFHRFNRLFLLGSVVLSALLPIIHITTNEQIEPIAEVIIDTPDASNCSAEYAAEHSNIVPKAPKKKAPAMMPPHLMVHHWATTAIPRQRHKPSRPSRKPQ